MRNQATFVDRVAFAGNQAAHSAPEYRPSTVGKYEVHEKIGEGGFAKVYRGHDPVLARTVAIKICSSRDRGPLTRFFREGRITGELQHPNITTIYDLGMEGDTAYLVEELLSGHDLSNVLRARLAPRRLVEILLDVAKGLAYAHTHGVLHRDIKPSNIRVTAEGQVKIMDFGIARRMARGNTLTAVGFAVGTAGYQAPELLVGLKADVRADVFSFGVLAYTALARRRPFPGETLTEICQSLMDTDPPPLKDACPECPLTQLSDLVAGCLEKERDDRISSMQYVAGELQDILKTLRFQEEQERTMKFHFRQVLPRQTPRQS